MSFALATFFYHLTLLRERFTTCVRPRCTPPRGRSPRRAAANVSDVVVVSFGSDSRCSVNSSIRCFKSCRSAWNASICDLNNFSALVSGWGMDFSFSAKS